MTSSDVGFIIFDMVFIGNFFNTNDEIKDILRRLK